MGGKSNIKLEFRSGTPLLKLLIVLLIVLCSVTLVALGWYGSGILEDVRAMKQEAAALEHDNQVLAEKIDDLGSIQSVRDIAKEELGLVDPDSVIIQPD